MSEYSGDNKEKVMECYKKYIEQGFAHRIAMTKAMEEVGLGKVNPNHNTRGK